MSKKSKHSDKGDNEPPATKDQVEFLRRYTELGEEALANISCFEAAEMVDRERERQQKEADQVVPRGLGIGCFKSLLILVLLAAIGGALWLLDHRKKAAAAEEAAATGDGGSRVEKVAPKSDPSMSGGSGGTSRVRDKPAPPPPPPEPPKPVWPPEKYPAVCRAMAPITLRAEDGSKVEIGEGESFHVLAMPRPNIWRFQYQGKVLVGSGSRVEGKVTSVKR